MRILDRLRNRKNLFFFLFDGVLIASVIFLVLRQSLPDYERLCRDTTDPKKKEKLALEAVAFLVRQDVPDSIAHQVNQEVANENLRLPANTLLFPEIPPLLNDSLAGLYDGLLTENLPKLYWMRRNQPDSVQGENFSTARRIAAQVDSHLNYSYWVPLLDFLEKADNEAWQRWRAAAKAADLSRTAYTQSQFECAKFLAVSGFHSLVTIPDRRLYLDICLRLQNAIAEGPESMFNIGFALADWVTHESRSAEYFLRIVSSEFNCGNQLFQVGRYDEALEKFKTVTQLAQQWRHFQPVHMQWYASEVIERITAVLYELGDYSAMLKYMDQYGRLATDTRQKTLYHLNLGLAARLIGDFQTAEEEFQQAIMCGKGDKNLNGDPANVWYAYCELGSLYLQYNLPEKALDYFQNANAFAINNANILSAERLSTYWLYLAEAFGQKSDILSAKKSLNEAKKQLIDSPLLRAQSLLNAARIYENLGQMDEAADMLEQARKICKNFGMTIYEIDAILQQVALAFKASKDFQPPTYSTKELENLLAKVNKSGARQQLVHSLALAVEAASRAGRFEQAKQYATWLLQETEALSRLYDHEQRLIFFQHSIYDDVKAAIVPDIRLAKIDSAFIKLDYVKARALRRKITGLQVSTVTTSNLPYANIDKIQKQLPPNEAVVDYMVAEDTLYAFVLTRSELQIFSTAVSRRELHARVHEYLAELTPDEQNQSDYDEQGQQRDFLKAIQLSHDLYNKLFGTIAGFLEKIDRLYIVADEFLHFLPFNTLVVQDGLAPEFLINRKAIAYLPAVSLWSLVDEAVTNKATPPSMLASVDFAMHGAPKILDRLVELKNIQVTAKTYWENQTEIETCLASHDQLYLFYAHAEANWDDPWQSYIRFPLRQSQQHGKLTYADVDSIDWRSAALVILAGCQTTGNRFYSGAGLSGLQRSFLGAGAKQVLATFWKVDAGQVAPQMSDFLEAWNRSGDAVWALQKMQQAAIARLKIDPYLNYPHPRYWGAYNLTVIKSTAYSSQGYVARSFQ